MVTRDTGVTLTYRLDDGVTLTYRLATTEEGQYQWVRATAAEEPSTPAESDTVPIRSV